MDTKNMAKVLEPATSDDPQKVAEHINAEMCKQPQLLVDLARSEFERTGERGMLFEPCALLDVEKKQIMRFPVCGYSPLSQLGNLGADVMKILNEYDPKTEAFVLSQLQVSGDKTQQIYNDGNLVKAPQSGCHTPGCESAKGAQLKQCAGCGTTSYCSRECQVKHWKMHHKKNCKPKKVT
uniref:MYND-type domain-containing protein n=1 Tax=Mucochytrium quahogii TaxID=96639 RepID=A0A7S2R7E6_9STRA|mmetsp:Transcript_13915/g.22717  ORF Transcript_13915/g.22717 Transcript_13915/m.22717 type:complete len:180 (+) Transcript_13915:58-597(+)